MKIKGPEELKKAKPHGGSLPGGLAFIPLRAPHMAPLGCRTDNAGAVLPRPTEKHTAAHTAFLRR